MIILTLSSLDSSRGTVAFFLTEHSGWLFLPYKFLRLNYTPSFKQAFFASLAVSCFKKLGKLNYLIANIIHFQVIHKMSKLDAYLLVKLFIVYFKICLTQLSILKKSTSAASFSSNGNLIKSIGIWGSFSSTTKT